MEKLRADYIMECLSPLFQNTFSSRLFSKNININIKTRKNIVCLFFIGEKLIFHIKELK
jgi:hypothetical protein